MGRNGKRQWKGEEMEGTLCNEIDCDGKGKNKRKWKGEEKGEVGRETKEKERESNKQMKDKKKKEGGG